MYEKKFRKSSCVKSVPSSNSVFCSFLKKLNCRERMNASTTFLAMSMFVLVKETASGCVLLEHAGSSTTRTPVVADKWFSVLSGVSTDYQRSAWLKQSVFRPKLDCQSPSGPVG